MKKNRMRGSVSLVLVTIALAVLVAALPIARAMTMPAAEGQTKVDANPVACHVAISAPVNGTDYHLDSNPDTVRMPYNVSWDDRRTGLGLPTAYHNFTLDTEHLSSPGPHAEKRVTTTGGSGSVTLWSNVTNVYSGQYVNITFAASVSGPTGTGCPASDSFTLSYHYVWP